MHIGCLRPLRQLRQLLLRQTGPRPTCRQFSASTNFIVEFLVCRILSCDAFKLLSLLVLLFRAEIGPKLLCRIVGFGRNEN